MKVLRAKVTTFKSIDDSGWVDIGDVTCLVGKNESGKTAFLQALRNLNPEPDVDGSFQLTDYPRKGFIRYQGTHETSPAVVVAAEFELGPAEVGALEGTFGKGIITDRKITLSKNYKNQVFVAVQVNETMAVAHEVAAASMPSDIAATLSKAPTIEHLKESVASLNDKPPSVEEFETALKAKFAQPLMALIRRQVRSLVPYFLYFDEYSTMRGRIAIQDMIARSGDTSKLNGADRTFLNLLKFAHISLEDFVGGEKTYEFRKAQLEAAAISITDEVFEFWSQNKQLQVEFDESDADASDPAPLNSGKILHVRIRNDRHRVTVPFDERSRGFVWFFSFLVYFSQIDKHHGLVLLLDEPGLSLHAKAQSDFLAFIDSRLAPEHQVIYSTHSPFMIEPSKLNRVRTVEDRDNEGTVISGDVLLTDRDTIFPLQAALGYDLAQTLFVGPNCLLVEGPSDLIYLQLFATATIAAGKIGLDPRWVVVPVGGADKVSTFVSLLGANQLNTAVLIDISNRDQQRIQGLQANSQLGPNSLVRITEFTGSKSADIEDLFAPAFYLELVNSAYADKLTAPILEADIAQGDPRIVGDCIPHGVAW